jgi:hypothetical protein
MQAALMLAAIALARLVRGIVVPVGRVVRDGGRRVVGGIVSWCDSEGVHCDDANQQRRQ